MNKPIVVIREEFEQKLANTINECGLPAFVIEPILHDFLNEIRIVSKKQYEIEKAQYEQYLEAENKKLQK